MIAGRTPAIVAPAVTRRRVRRITARATAWVDWPAGVVELPAASATTTPEPTVRELVGLAERHQLARVFLTGPRPHAGDPDAWARWCDADPGPGWAGDGHYLERPDAPVLRWRHEDGRRVELLRAAQWCGEDASPATARDAWDALGELVAGEWPGAVLMTTPATTGRELLSWSIPSGTEWPTLPDHLAELVRSTSGQGRIEFRRLGDELPGLVELDGRLMYGALCRELPGGPVEHGPGLHGHGPYARSRLLCEWTVPDGWEHLGILPARDEGGGWRYPCRPGERAVGWVDGVEAHLALNHGWRVRVREHLVWPHKAGPLDGWARRLLAIYGAAQDAYGDELGELVRRGCRRLVIDTIGALVGRPMRVTRSLPVGRAGEVPAGAESPRVEGGRIVWAEQRPPAWPEMIHPEWSAAVWARCRARMLSGPGQTGALHVPLAQVVAIRTDALYLTRDPGWGDDGRPGRLRVKAAYPGPLPAPASAPALVALRDRLAGR